MAPPKRKHAHDDPAFAARALEVLRARGLRVTRQRRALVELLDRSCDPLMPYEIKARLDRRGEPIDTVSVYRILDCFERRGIVHKILSSGGYVKCHLAPDEAACHHYLLCRTCRRVEEIPCSGLAALERESARRAGFRVEEHRVELRGLCSDCR